MKGVKIVFAAWVVVVAMFMSSVFLCGYTHSIDSWQAAPWFVACILTGLMLFVVTMVLMKTLGLLSE